MPEELTSEEVQKKLKEPLPKNKKLLKELQEQISSYMGGIFGEEDPLYQKLHDFLRSVEFRLQWKEMQESSRRMFLVAIVAALIAFFSVVVSVSFSDKLYREAIKSNQILSQPFLAFVAEYETPFKFVNEGNGPALNIVLIHGLYGNDGKTIFITKEEDILTALGPSRGQNILGNISGDKLVYISLEEVSDKLPFAYDYINNIMQKNQNWLCLIYEDLYGNKFSSTVYGVGGEYRQAIEFTRF